ncbi:MAG TPA: hypothetical protein VN364_05165 [Bellilinea sp.]|nr:hypothetical protein [Bellilinea sp.]
MSDQLAKKLLIKPGSRILVRNAPPGYLDKLELLSDGGELLTTVEGSFDVVLQFVQHKADVDSQALESTLAVREGGIVWMIYPKRSKSIQSDINRDAGWDVLWQAGWVGIAIVAIDDAWAALRFRPVKDVKRKPDSIFLK